MKILVVLAWLTFIAVVVSADKKKEDSGKAEWPVIGIDLGTTYSCVGVFKNGRVEIIANDLGSRTTPSWVAFTDSDRLIGEAAKNQAPLNPENTGNVSHRLVKQRKPHCLE